MSTIQAREEQLASHQASKLDALAGSRGFRRNQEICGQGQPFREWYCIIRGAARRFTYRLDGGRQVIGLLLPGDFFGLTIGQEYEYTTESIAGDTVVSVFPRSAADKLADSDPVVAREIRAISLSIAAQLQTQLLIVGRTTATEKVGSFLLEMSRRLIDSEAGCIRLPVSRYDIADYLSISAETVSRSLSDLNQRGYIAFRGARYIRIVNRSALEGSLENGATSRPPGIPTRNIVAAVG